MALTPDLVARVHRVVEDSGPLPGLAYHSEEDYDAAVRDMLASHPRGEDLWLFVYGSLIWKPEMEHVEERIGVAHGWHRSFCLRLIRWRGTSLDFSVRPEGVDHQWREVPPGELSVCSGS